MSVEKEISLVEIPKMFSGYVRSLLRKWHWIALAGIAFGLGGILYAWKQKPRYTAEITFAPENEKGGGMSMYAGLAAQFGFDLGGGGGGVFEGENLMEFLKSRMLIEKALLSPLDSSGKLLIDHYLDMNEMREDWPKKPVLKNIRFYAGQPPERNRDSIMNLTVKDVGNNLLIEKKDKMLNIISVKMVSNDERFAKSFVENLVDNGIQYYVDYRSKKTRENVQILQRQADSVRGMLRGDIMSAATTTDLNVNPLRQVVRAGVQRKQVDVQVNGALYGEILKQLELSKITLRKETPLVQIIDTPRYPLEKKKMGRLKGAIIFGFFGVLIAVLFFTVKNVFAKPRINSAV